MMAIETLCGTAMIGMFGVFLIGVWMETRRAMRRLEENDEAFVLAECEREYHQALRQQSTQASARARLQMLREQNTPENGLGMEQIGRILDRLASGEAREYEGAAELNFVPGGARTPSIHARDTNRRAA